MKFLGNPQSKMYKTCMLIANLFILNMLFLLSCVFIINIAGSVIALSIATKKIIENDEESSIFKTFVKAYKENFWLGLKMSLFSLVCIGILLTSYVVTIHSTFFAKPVILVGLILASVITLVSLLYWFPYVARYQDKFFKSLRTCFQIACLNPKSTIFLFGVPLIGIYLFTLGNLGFALATWFFLLVGFSTIVYVSGKFSGKIFKQYEVQ